MINSVTKRMLSVLMAAILILSLVPMAAFASGEEETTPASGEAAVNEVIPAAEEAAGAAEGSADDAQAAESGEPESGEPDEADAVSAEESDEPAAEQDAPEMTEAPEDTEQEIVDEPETVSMDSLSGGRWVSENGSWAYYVGEDKVTGLQEIDGDLYYFDEDSGLAQTGWWIIDGEMYYFSTSNWIAAKGLTKIDSTYYFFDESTCALAGPGLVTASDGHRYCLSENGIVQTGWKTIDGNTYYFGATLKYALAGIWTLSGTTYYFDEDTCVLGEPGLVTTKSGFKYYVGSNGAIQTGWKTVDGKTYFFGETREYALSGMWTLGGTTYYFDEDTCELRGAGLITAKDGHMYYTNANGVVQTGWRTVDGKTYYFGRLSKYALSGLWTLSGTTYYFDEDTCEVGTAGLVTAKDGHMYYLNANGAVQTGWRTVDGKTYYFGRSSLYALSGAWTLSGTTYYFDEDTCEWLWNSLVTAKDGHMYYLDENGVVQTGWKTIDGKTYYFGRVSKYALSGLWTLSGTTYYFDEDTCELGTAGFVTAGDGHRYYLNENGVVQTGWKTIDGKTYYFGVTLKYALTGAWTLGNTTYYFDDVTGELGHEGFNTASDGHRYYLNANGVVQTGWRTIDGKTYYFGATSKYALTGVWTLGGNVYYFDDVTGELQGSGWATDSEGNRYYIDENGYVVSGWWIIDGKTYYFGQSSKKALTGFWELSSGDYVFDENGALVTGNGRYTAADGSVYYLSGSNAKTGWITENGKTYYCSPTTGKMFFGWQMIGLYRYYFYEEEGENYGSMAAGVEIDGVKIDEAGRAPTEVKTKMDLLTKQYTSGTDYLMMVDTTNCKVGVYTRGQNGWETLYYWDCICGKWSGSHDTPVGLFRTSNNYYSFGNNYYTCYYGTSFYANSTSEYLFHSLLYYTQGGGLIPGQPLGYHISNGCVRLAWENCKWVYYNIPYGTTVYSY